MEKVKHWIELGSEFLKDSTSGMVSVKSPVESFNFGANSFRGIYRSNLVPTKAMKLKIRWTAVKIPGQGENIVLREIVMDYRKEVYKAFSEEFFCSFSLDTDLKFPVGEYKVEVFQNDDFLVSRSFEVKEGFTLKFSTEQTIKTLSSVFRKGTSKVYMEWHSSKIRSGEGKVQWIFVRKISSTSLENKLLSYVVVNSPAYDRISHDLDAADLPAGIVRCEVYFRKPGYKKSTDGEEEEDDPKSWDLESYKEFSISPALNFAFGCERDLGKKFALKRQGRFFSADVPKIIAVVSVDALVFPKGTKISAKWLAEDVSNKPRGTVLCSTSSDMHEDFNVCSFEWPKPKPHSEKGVVALAVNLGDLCVETAHFFIGVTFDILMGRKIEHSETPGIKNPLDEFSSMKDDRIYGLCRSNHTFAKGTPICIVWSQADEDGEGETKKMMICEQKMDMHQECNVIVFAFGKPPEGFPVGNHVCEVKIFDVVVQEKKFSITK